jgi:hypothetical protein
MSVVITKSSGYYFVNGQFYIIADDPGSEMRIKEHPEIPAMTLAELERITPKVR